MQKIPLSVRGNHEYYSSLEHNLTRKDERKVKERSFGVFSHRPPLIGTFLPIEKRLKFKFVFFLSPISILFEILQKNTPSERSNKIFENGVIKYLKDSSLKKNKNTKL